MAASSKITALSPVGGDCKSSAQGKGRFARTSNRVLRTSTLNGCRFWCEPAGKINPVAHGPLSKTKPPPRPSPQHERRVASWPATLPWRPAELLIMITSTYRLSSVKFGYRRALYGTSHKHHSLSAYCKPQTRRRPTQSRQRKHPYTANTCTHASRIAYLFKLLQI